MFVARFTYTPEQDIAIGMSGFQGMWSLREAVEQAGMHPDCVGVLPSDDELLAWVEERDPDESGVFNDPRFLCGMGEPVLPGHTWRVFHHYGLSCWPLDAETAEEALAEAASRAAIRDLDDPDAIYWAGFGAATVGSVKLIGCADAAQHLWVFECRDVEVED